MESSFRKFCNITHNESQWETAHEVGIEGDSCRVAKYSETILDFSDILVLNSLVFLRKITNDA